MFASRKQEQIRLQQEIAANFDNPINQILSF